MLLLFVVKSMVVSEDTPISDKLKRAKGVSASVNYSSEYLQSFVFFSLVYCTKRKIISMHLKLELK